MVAYKISQGEVIVVMQDTVVIGWLRYGYFWDSIPYMNMLTVLEPYRGQGIGTQLIACWENLLRDKGFTEVLTSTMTNERSQFRYRRLGYEDCGALILPGEPIEIILRKSIADKCAKTEERCNTLGLRVPALNLLQSHSKISAWKCRSLSQRSINMPFLKAVTH